MIKSDNLATESRITTAVKINSTEDPSRTRVTPKELTEYIGQDKVKRQLEIFIQASRKRQGSSRSCFTIWSTEV